MMPLATLLLASPRYATSYKQPSRVRPRTHDDAAYARFVRSCKEVLFNKFKLSALLLAILLKRLCLILEEEEEVYCWLEECLFIYVQLINTRNRTR